jgi:hypothetical protein
VDGEDLLVSNPNHSPPSSDEDGTEVEDDEDDDQTSNSEMGCHKEEEQRNIDMECLL